MKIKVEKNKTLKLINVLSTDIYAHELEGLILKIQQIENYITINNAKKIGPLIQYTMVEGENLKNKIIFQIDKKIENLNYEFNYQDEWKITNCLYCRYNGPNEKIDMAYSKLKVFAFEEDIKLTGKVYTIYLEEGEDESIIDVFMECI